MLLVGFAPTLCGLRQTHTFGDKQAAFGKIRNCKCSHTLAMVMLFDGATSCFNCIVPLLVDYCS